MIVPMATTSTTLTPTSQQRGSKELAASGHNWTQRIAVHPSSAIPGAPAFVFSVPDGWVIDEAPGAVAVVRPQQQIADFWVNAVLSHDRVARSVDFRQAAAFTWDRVVKQAPDAQIGFEKFFRRDDLVVYLRGSQLIAPRSARSIAQLHAIFFAPVVDSGKLVDFFQVVGTAPVEVMDQIGPALLEVVTSFRFV
jgi:hypothetical protein